MNKAKQKILDTALSKLKPSNSNSRIWCGYLSYAEIAELHKNGYREDENGWTFKYATEKMLLGINGQTWIYYAKLGNTDPKYIRQDRHNKLKNKPQT